jgi:hypothetical protein
MPNRFSQFYKKYSYELLLLVIVVFCAISSYSWGTWLLGWDSLSDEFNFGVNFKRQFFGVWNEYQGLGTAGGHTHAADIPRFLFLYFSNFFLPASFLRYFYLFFTLTLGVLGVFKLVIFLLGGFKFNAQIVKKISFVTALFYFFNLGTLQITYVPFEMFNAQYLVLPWVTLYLLKYLKSGGGKYFAILMFWFFLGLPMSYAPIFFYVFFGYIVSFLCVYFIVSNHKSLIFKRCALCVLGLITINLYWILPNIYYIANYSTTVSHAHINRLFSEDAFLHSSKWGTILDFPILRGFLFGWQSLKTNEEFGFLMQSWRGHTSTITFYILGFTYFFVVLVGFFKGLIRRNVIVFALTPAFLGSLFMVIGYNTPFIWIWDLLRENIGLFKEGLRFPWTKFSVLLQFIYTIFFAFGLSYLYSSNKVKKVCLLQTKVGGSKTVGYFAFLVLAFSFVFYMWPFFKGSLIAPEVKVKLHNDYINVFDYYSNLDSSSRIAYLPAHTLYGWSYYNWEPKGYQGAGFIWFGLNQSFLTRDFDRWHDANEQFYNEFQYAIYSENPTLLKNILQKYQINYLLLDKNVIAPGSPGATFYPQTILLLAKTSGVERDKSFGDIDVYKVEIATPQAPRNDSTLSYVYAPDSFEVVSSTYDFSNADSNFGSNTTNYIEGSGGLSFPFADDKDLANALQNNRLTFNSGGAKKLSVKDFDQSASLPATLSVQQQGGNTNLVVNYIYPAISGPNGFVYSYNFADEYSVPLSQNTGLLIDNKLFQGELRNNYLIGFNSKLVAFNSETSSSIDFGGNLYALEPFNCLDRGSNTGSFGKTVSNGVLTLFSRNAHVCADFEKTFSIQNPSVIRVEFDYKSDTNNKPLYCVSDGKSCLNQKYANSAFTSSTPSKYVDYFYVQNPTNNLTLSLILENLSTSESRVEISNVKVSIFDSTFNTSLKPSANAYKTGASVVLDQNTNYNVNVPDYGSLSYKYNAGTKYFNPTAKNCDNFNAKAYGREFVVGGGNSHFNYTATDAISCDSVKTKNMQGEGSYLVTFNTQNIKGKALDICIAGTNLDKCMVLDRLQRSEINNEELTINNEKMQRQSFIVPSYPSVSEYSINISNQSIGRVESENNLYSIETKYIPYNFLKSIMLDSGNASFENNLQVASVMHKYPHRYDLVINNEQLTINNKDTELQAFNSKNKYGLIVLNQSFDSGWGLYKADSCRWGVVSPVTCSKASADHLLAKNWANSWLISDEELIINNEIPASAGMTGVGGYYILFWPQWLQYLGYVFLFGWFLVVLIYAVIKR